MHKQRGKKSSLYFPIIRQYFSTTWEEEACVLISWEGKHWKYQMSPMEYPLGQFGSARCIPTQDFPYPAHCWEVECWKDSSEAVPALLTGAETPDEISIHPSITSTSVCVLHLFLDVLMFHGAISSKQLILLPPA